MKSDIDAMMSRTTMRTATTPRLRFIGTAPLQRTASPARLRLWRHVASARFCFWRDVSSARLSVATAERIAAPRCRRFLRRARLGWFRRLDGRRGRHLHELVERQIEKVAAARFLVDENLAAV